MANSALSSDGFNPLPSRGGYNFSVVVPSTVPAGYVRVYNPAFAPDGGFNPSGSSYNMHEQDGDFMGNSYTDQYSAMEYTVFKVNDIFDHSKDTPLSQVIVDPLNMTITGGAVSSIVDVRNGQTIPPASSAFTYIVNNIYHNWMDVGTPPKSSTQWTSSGTTYNMLDVIQDLPGGSSLLGHIGSALTCSTIRDFVQARMPALRRARWRTRGTPCNSPFPAVAHIRSA